MKGREKREKTWSKKGRKRKEIREPERWLLSSKERTRNIPYPLQLPNNSNVGPDSGGQKEPEIRLIRGYRSVRIATTGI